VSQVHKGAGELELQADNGSVDTHTSANHDWHTLASTIDWECVGGELGLSPREREVVQHIFAGQKLSAVARDLGLGLGTVKTYCQRVYQKLHVTDQRELMLAVLEAHLFLLHRSA
jgi:DNA-binding NarL/FixJ family response regulator